MRIIMFKQYKIKSKRCFFKNQSEKLGIHRKYWDNFIKEVDRTLNIQRKYHKKGCKRLRTFVMKNKKK